MNRPRSFDSSKKECWEFQGKIDVGVILEQSWMLEEVIRNFKDGSLTYCFLVDKYLYILKCNGKTYLFLDSNGASIVACRVEEMVKWNAKKIFRVGTCGALQDNINVGDVVVSAAAIRDEGTSDHYAPRFFPSIPNPEFMFKFQEMLSCEGISTHVGITWTTDGRFVESDEKLLSFSRMNVKNVDMETSAFLIVCWVRKVLGLSIGIVTDRPLDDLKTEFKGKIHDLPTVKEIACQLLPKIIYAILNLEKDFDQKWSE